MCKRTQLEHDVWKIDNPIPREVSEMSSFQLMRRALAGGGVAA